MRNDSTNTTANIDRRKTEPEPARPDHLIADEELARVVGGADHTCRADLSSLSIQKPLDKAS